MTVWFLGENWQMWGGEKGVARGKNKIFFTEEISMVNDIEETKLDDNEFNRQLFESMNEAILKRGEEKVKFTGGVISSDEVEIPPADPLDNPLKDYVFFCHTHLPKDIWAEIKKANACFYIRNGCIEEFNDYVCDHYNGWLYKIDAIKILLDNGLRVRIYNKEIKKAESIDEISNVVYKAIRQYRNNLWNQREKRREKYKSEQKNRNDNGTTN